ncbi:TMEM165/GDT1 family protein [Phormidium sp. CLA17]|uniref:TMEM165/GDT1 family protein n=1 Tax=Leptolyngbya sp. Cla-17 TaxID=2803751 RepID=UPI001490A6F3|nr:TMEM165/GDT1 family protein [Leptolyngbya sp. Cla-17]MBM0741139.1 TMEM165/GDT1 family protein [Leptolyngbya sp. Cla-17]
MLAAFTSGFLLVGISELGDKTFFIAMLLAMRHSRRLVFLGVVVALAIMTILSILMGQAISLLPKYPIHLAEVTLFIGFGLKLLYDSWQMPSKATCDEVAEAEAAIQDSDLEAKAGTAWGIIWEAFILTFLAEWGDRTQFATIALAATYNPWGVTMGAIAGHTLCAAIAVVGGRLVAGRISERTSTALGGSLFIVFGIAAAVEGVPTGIT